jgi:uncharacterized integral membrane protein
MTSIPSIVSFLILCGLVVAGLQNSAPLDVRFAWWTLQLSVSTAITWSAAAGALVVALVSLPRLSVKSFQNRRLRKEVQRLEDLCKCSPPEKEG